MPGGPNVNNRALLVARKLDFSFSGLKTAVLRWTEAHPIAEEIAARGHQHRAESDRAIGADRHLAADRRVRRDARGRIDGRALALVFQDHGRCSNAVAAPSTGQCGALQIP